MKPIILLGAPGPVGGARTESGDTALLWRSMGLPVSVLPVSTEPENPWTPRLKQAGCKVWPEIKPNDWPSQPWLFRSIVVDFACERAARNWDRLARMGCELVHVPCHCFTLPYEYDSFRHRPPSAVMFQSEYQRNCLSLQYTQFGVPAERQYLIHGAFDLSAYATPHPPRDPETELVVGRIARDVPSKWPPFLFRVLELAHEVIPLRAICLGWTKALEPFTGKPPGWIECHAPGSLAVRELLATLHCLLCFGMPSEPAENWSRVVLEAFAAGVPVVADRRGGYCEQIEHNKTGILVESVDDAAQAIVRLAMDEAFRADIGRRAFASLKTLANPQRIGDQWRRLFDDLKKS